MTKILDRGNESSVADDVMEILAERGYSVEEAIPGLISAIVDLAFSSSNPEQVLDEAADLLSDVQSDEEVDEPDPVDEEDDEEEVAEVDEYGKVIDDIPF